MIDLRVQQLKLELNPKFTKHDAVSWAMPFGPLWRASHRATLRCLGLSAPVAIAAFCVVWFGLQLVRGAL